MARSGARRAVARSKPIPGAKRAPFPGFIEPCLATLRESVPRGDQWIHEIKFDGYRAQAHMSASKSRIYTRRGYDWTPRFRPIAEAIGRLQARNCILDGEVIVADTRGVSDFASLQADLASGRVDRLAYYIFDLLYLDGVDLPRRSFDRSPRSAG